MNSTLWTPLSLSLMSCIHRDFTSKIILVSLEGDKEDLSPKGNLGWVQCMKGRTVWRAREPASTSRQGAFPQESQFFLAWNKVTVDSFQFPSPDRSKCQSVTGNCFWLSDTTTFEIEIKACESRVRKVDINVGNSPTYLERLTWSEIVFSGLSFQVFYRSLKNQSVGVSHLAVVRWGILKTWYRSPASGRENKGKQPLMASISPPPHGGLIFLLKFWTDADRDTCFLISFCPFLFFPLFPYSLKSQSKYFLKMNV